MSGRDCLAIVLSSLLPSLGVCLLAVFSSDPALRQGLFLAAGVATVVSGLSAVLARFRASGDASTTATLGRLYGGMLFRVVSLVIAAIAFRNLSGIDAKSSFLAMAVCVVLALFIDAGMLMIAMRRRTSQEPAGV